MRVLVVGATGQYAGLVVPELKRRGVTVRALIRDQRQEAYARERGAEETVLGNLENPTSLLKAAKGMDGVFHINPAFTPHEFDMGIAMIEGARAAGVRRFVFSGVIHPSILSLSNHAAKLPVEEVLYQSGMNFTVLQPTMFMQSIENAWPDLVQRARFALPYSIYRKASYVDYRDVAEVVGLAFSSDRLDYGTFELCAPGMVDRAELAELMSEAVGFRVKAGEVQFDEWANAAHLPLGPVRDGLRQMYADYDRHGFPGGNPLVLRAILGREPRTLRQFVHELAASEQRRAA